jgi:hypothetical protein
MSSFCDRTRSSRSVWVGIGTRGWRGGDTIRLAFYLPHGTDPWRRIEYGYLQGGK